MRTIPTQEELNRIGEEVDETILEFLNEHKGESGTPSLAMIALAARTSPYVVMQRLRELGQEEKPETSTETRKQKQRKTATGFTGGDRNFLRQCGVAVGD